MTKIIDLKNVWKVYGAGDSRVEALRGVDFRVKKGEFVSVLGPSGSGKSTLLHIIGVLDRQTRGTVRVANADVGKLSDRGRTAFRLRNLGFVFQFYALLPELTAVENVQLVRMLDGVRRGAARQPAAKAMAALGLGDRLDHYPHQLSGGQQQRVGIARALVNDPKLLLADEPTASLDSASAKNVLSVFRELSDSGQTVVLITHEEALGKFADRGVWLTDGRIGKERRF